MDAVEIRVNKNWSFLITPPLLNIIFPSTQYFDKPKDTGTKVKWLPENYNNAPDFYSKHISFRIEQISNKRWSPNNKLK